MDTLAERLDRELRMRGSSLEQWAAEYGLTPRVLVRMVEGESARVPEIMHALRETIGADLTVCYRQVAA